MFMKWLKKLFPSSEINHSDTDIQETIDEAKQVADRADEANKEARVAIIKYSNAAGEVAKKIEDNGFAKLLRYDKNFPDHDGQRKEHGRK